MRKNTEARNAEVARLYQEGLSMCTLSERFGICISYVSQILKQQGVLARRQGRPNHGCVNDAAVQQRNEQIAHLYKDGLTLETIGQKYGLTRERIRQIVKLGGVSRAEGGRAIGAQRRKVRKVQEKAAFYLKQFGHTTAEHQRLLQMDQEDRKAGVSIYGLRMYRFRQARNNLRQLYGWTLTVAQWWAIWEASGKWSLHGRGIGHYGMVRLDRSKGFEPSNVAIKKLDGLNAGDQHWTKRIKSVERPPEVRLTLREVFEQAALAMGQVSTREERKNDTLG